MNRLAGAPCSVFHDRGRQSDAFALGQQLCESLPITVSLSILAIAARCSLLLLAAWPA